MNKSQNHLPDAPCGGSPNNSGCIQVKHVDYKYILHYKVSVSLAPTCQPSPNCQSSLTAIASLGQGYYCIRLSVCLCNLG